MCPFTFFGGFVHVPLYLYTFIYLFTSLLQSSALLPDLEPQRWLTSALAASWPDQMMSPHEHDKLKTNHVNCCKQHH